MCWFFFCCWKKQTSKDGTEGIKMARNRNTKGGYGNNTYSSFVQMFISNRGGSCFFHFISCANLSEQQSLSQTLHILTRTWHIEAWTRKHYYVVHPLLVVSTPNGLTDEVSAISSSPRHLSIIYAILPNYINPQWAQGWHRWKDS